MIKPIVLYEWVDCQGEVEDFIIFELSDNIHIRKVFDFPNTKMMICFGEEANALRQDFQRRTEE